MSKCKGEALNYALYYFYSSNALRLSCFLGNRRHANILTYLFLHAQGMIANNDEQTDRLVLMFGAGICQMGGFGDCIISILFILYSIIIINCFAVQI